MTYTVTAGYGQCVEGFFAAEEAMIRAAVAGDWSEYALAARERKDWAELAKRTPKFVEEPPHA